MIRVTVFLSHENPEILLDTVNSELKKVILWIHANKLSLNLQKTNYMFFSNSLRDLPGGVIFGDTNIVKVTSTMQVSWATH